MREDRRLRLFVALEIPEAWRAALVHQVQRLEAAAPGFTRWVDSGNLHLTLVFLGSQPAASVPQIVEALDTASASQHAFTLHPRELGAFGPPRRLQVLWAGVLDAPPGALAGLHRAVIRALAGQGISFDRTPFRAHITLGRGRRDAAAGQSEAMATAVARGELWADGLPALCDEVVLFQSDLRASGPIYTALHRAQLSPGSTGGKGGPTRDQERPVEGEAASSAKRNWRG